MKAKGRVRSVVLLQFRSCGRKHQEHGGSYSPPYTPLTVSSIVFSCLIKSLVNQRCGILRQSLFYFDMAAPPMQIIALLKGSWSFACRQSKMDQNCELTKSNLRSN